MRDPDKPLSRALRFSDGIHAAGIARPPVKDQRDIDVHDIAVAQLFRIRETMADKVIDRCAAGVFVRNWGHLI